jgi:cation transport regulator ChaC
MAIVKTEVESTHGAGSNRMIYYRCQDHEGIWHSYGPVITIDERFDADEHKSVVAVRLAEALAAAEFEATL